MKTTLFLCAWLAIAFFSIPHFSMSDEQKSGSDEQNSGILFQCEFETADWHNAWGYSASPRNTSIIAKDAALKFEPLDGKALRIEVENGGHYGTSFQYRFQDQIGSEPEVIYFQYWLRLADDWSPAQGGKFPGISGTYNRAGWGGRPVNGRDGWSARGLFRGVVDGKTPIGFYCYHMDMKGKYGSEWLWDKNQRGMLEPNKWHCIEQCAKINTPGKSDGVLQAWIDNQLAFEKYDVRMREVDSLKIEAVWMNVYLGGSWTSKKTQHLFIDRVKISRQPLRG